MLVKNKGETMYKEVEESPDGKAYWKDGRFYLRHKVICGICAREMGRTDNPDGELSYCGCEEPEPRY